MYRPFLVIIMVVLSVYTSLSVALTAPARAAALTGFCGYDCPIMGVSWSNAKNLTVYDAFDAPEWKAVLIDAVAQWNQSPYVHLTIKPGQDGFVRGAIVASDVNNDCSISLAQIMYHNSRITSVRIPLTDGTGCPQPLSEVPYTGLLHVICHELGHALGLGHVPVDAVSCLGPGYQVSAGNLQNLALIYGH